jgi:hypothetical protein
MRRRAASALRPTGLHSCLVEATALHLTRACPARPGRRAKPQTASRVKLGPLVALYLVQKVCPTPQDADPDLADEAEARLEQLLAEAKRALALPEDLPAAAGPAKPEQGEAGGGGGRKEGKGRKDKGRRGGSQAVTQTQVG